MLLQFRSPYASITQFNPVEIADFTVLTGVNGSGKSQLLQAINDKKAVIQGMENAHIVLFNYENFRLDNEPTFTGHQLSSEREQAWNYFNSHVKNQAQSWRTGLGQNYDQAREKASQEKKSFWRAGGDLIRSYKQQATNYFKSKNLKSNAQAQGIFSLVKKTPYSIDEIDRDDFVKRYKPFVFKNDFLPIQLGKVFWDYYVKYRENQINDFENERNGKSYPVLTDAEFINAHGEKPWELANKILRAFDSLTYEIVSPEGQDFFGSYKLQLRHTKRPNLYVEFDRLSSGERILMALVASIYKASTDGNFPDILLLDEVDASLHPSMMKNMLSVIEDVFLPEGVKVILVTHSATTIALSPETSVYIMAPDGLNRIQKKSQKQALSILTQGYATLDEGLRFLDEMAKSKMTIVTEGKNTQYISMALRHRDVNNVEILDGIENISGKDQLKTFFNFVSRIPHQNKILFVFDCDVKFRLEPKNNTYAFTFPQNEINQLAERGIENLFSEDLFNGLCTTIKSSRGVETRKFDQSRKNDLLDRITDRNSPNDFVNFESLIEEIDKVSKL